MPPFSNAAGLPPATSMGPPVPAQRGQPSTPGIRPPWPPGKDHLPPSSMSELQKLINMQPSHSQGVSTGPEIPAGMVTMSTDQISQSLPSSVPLPPSTQPVKAHLGGPLEGKGQGRGPEGEEMLDIARDGGECLKMICDKSRACVWYQTICQFMIHLHPSSSSNPF